MIGAQVLQLDERRKPVITMTAKPIPPRRYFFDQHNDAWYIVPLDMQKSWQRYKATPTDYVPLFAQLIAGVPNSFSFADPRSET